MKNIPTFEEYINESYVNEAKRNLKPIPEIVKLYNGILNDGSIQRYSIGWKDVISAIEQKYKDLPKDKNVQFSNDLIKNALDNSRLPKYLVDILNAFAKELDINLETLRNKQK